MDELIYNFVNALVLSVGRAIREDKETTRELLTELGARGNTKEKELWTLDKN